jgi:hypothetical protein
LQEFRQFGRLVTGKDRIRIQDSSVARIEKFVCRIELEVVQVAASP